MAALFQAMMANLPTAPPPAAPAPIPQRSWRCPLSMCQGSGAWLIWWHQPIEASYLSISMQVDFLKPPSSLCKWQTQDYVCHIIPQGHGSLLVLAHSLPWQNWPPTTCIHLECIWRRAEINLWQAWSHHVRTSIQPALYCNIWLYVTCVFGSVWEQILLVHLHNQLLYSLSVTSIYTIFQ